MKKCFAADVLLELLGLTYSDLERTIPSEDCTDWRDKYEETVSYLMNGEKQVRHHKPAVKIPLGYAGYSGNAVGR